MSYICVCCQMAVSVAGPDLGFLRLLNSTGGADALWMGDSGQMWLPMVEGASPGLKPRLCQFVPVRRRLDAGQLLPLLLMLIESVATFACHHSDFIDTISNDHAVHLRKLCQSVIYTHPLCHLMLKVESRAFFDTTGGVLQVGFHLGNPVCLFSPPSVPSLQCFCLNMSDWAVGNPTPICFV